MIVDEIKLLRRQHLMTGNTPRKITLSRRNYDRMLEELSEYVVYPVQEKEGEFGRIFGMEIDVNEDLCDEIMFVEGDGF